MELANLLGQGQRSEHNSQRNKKLDRRQAGRRSRMAGSAAPEFSVVLQRAEHFADWHVDDADRHELAGLQADEFGFAVGRCGIRGADSYVSSSAVRRRVGRSIGPPASPGRYASSCDVAVAGAGGSHAQQAHHHP